MDEAPGKKRMKEPVQKAWIWWVLAALVVFNAPWYLPEGMIEPYIFGIPAWVLLVLFLSVLLSAFLHWVARSQWDILEDEEEAAFAEERRRKAEEAGR
ncbi:hypothetical protein HGQ17_11450 [Nesterenkonia sp. MY13]|uniref:DUF3311 domain-containing protein n=1 Tax=Nesterenkonia sedimenti TaxID=1463632 RepID=A0A7X8TKY8_9MICC|nr:hypothetical protein [Nesterenkonia sedimenti]NLS10593.1 hypothetical protein [Nesterenkonia sedimenti]